MRCLYVYVSFSKLIRAKRIQFGAPELLGDSFADPEQISYLLFLLELICSIQLFQIDVNCGL